MDELLKDTPVEIRTPFGAAVGVLSGLAEIWEMWNFQQKMDFFEFVLDDLLEDENTSGESQIEELAKTENMTDWEGEPLVPGFKAAVVQIATLRVACAYSVQAMKAEKNSTEAWLFACDANHWLGILQGIISGRGLKSEDGQKTISNVAALGGKGRDALYEPLREMAKTLVQDKTFKSRRHAAMSIAPEIVKRSKELGLNMSEAQAPITVSEWLKNIGFAGKHDT